MSQDHYLPTRLWPGGRAVVGERNPDFGVCQASPEPVPLFRDLPCGQAPDPGDDPVSLVPADEVVRVLCLGPMPDDPGAAGPARPVWWRVMRGNGERGYMWERPDPGAPRCYLSPLSLAVPTGVSAGVPTLLPVPHPVRLHAGDDVWRPAGPWAGSLFDAPSVHASPLTVPPFEPSPEELRSFLLGNAPPEHIRRHAAIARILERTAHVDGRNIFRKLRVSFPDGSTVDGFAREVAETTEEPRHRYELVPLTDFYPAPIGGRAIIAARGENVAAHTRDLAWRHFSRLNAHIGDMLDNTGAFQMDAFVLTCDVG